MDKEEYIWWYTFDINNDYVGSDDYNSKEEAVNKAIEEWNTDKNLQKIYPDRKIFLAKANFYIEETDLADVVIKKMQENIEVSPLDYMNLSDEHLKILNKELNKTILRFQRKYKYEPDFFIIDSYDVVEF